MYTLVLFWIRFINAFWIKNEFEGLSFRSTVHRTWWEQSLRGASAIFVLFYYLHHLFDRPNLHADSSDWELQKQRLRCGNHIRFQSGTKTLYWKLFWWIINFSACPKRKITRTKTKLQWIRLLPRDHRTVFAPVRPMWTQFPRFAVRTVHYFR